jgi:hypothetical protein
MIRTGSSSVDWIYWPLRLQVLLITLNYNVTHFQFTVAHALGFSVSTSRLQATDLNTETITSNHYEVFLSLLQSPWNADPIFRF